MNWYLIVGSWLTGLHMVLAQPFMTLDNQSTAFKRSDDLPKLVQKLTVSAQTDLDKARILFIWTATHIHYDDSQSKPYRFGFAENPIDTLAAATQILRTKQGVCTDFSLLLYQLFQTAGLPVRIVTGYAKGQSDQAGTPIQFINHQWNMVFLEGKWQPLDATWASTNNGTRPLNLYYFLTPPARFIATHFPDDPADQLVENPLSKAEFDALPRVYEPYFTMGFGPDFPRQGLYQIKQKLWITLPNPAEMEFMVLAHRYGQPKRERTFYHKATHREQAYYLAMRVFRQGVYSVHILSRAKGDPAEHKLVLTLTVISDG